MSKMTHCKLYAFRTYRCKFQHIQNKCAIYVMHKSASQIHGLKKRFD